MKFKKRFSLIVLATVMSVSCFAAACATKPKGPGTQVKPPPGEITKPTIPSEGGIATPEDFKNVTIQGADDVEVLQGTYFDPFAGVAALSDTGKNISSQLKVSGDLNTSKTGEYSLLYYVFFGSGNIAEKTRKITVVKNEELGKEKPVPSYSPSNGDNYNIANGCEASATNTTDGSAYKAFDGDFSTRWESKHGEDNVNLTLNLGAVLKVDTVNIYWEAAYAVDFTLQISNNGLDWETVENVTDNALTMHVVEGKETYLNAFSYSDKEVNAQFVRIACTKRKTTFGYSVFEMQVLGPEGTVIPADSYPDLFDAQKESSPDWAQQTEEWLEFDLGEVKNVNRMRIAFLDNLTPASYKVLYAGADKNFTQLKTYNLPYSADWFRFNNEQDLTLQARYFRIELDALRFIASSYRINEVSFVYFEAGAAEDGKDRETKWTASVTASSYKAGHEPALMLDGDKDDVQTYWENNNNNVYKTVDLGEAKGIGRVDLYWYGADGGKGKYYDLQISTDGVHWTTVFRQTHGATPKQSVYVYETARYIRIIDMQSPDTYRYMLEGMVVHSQYPASSGEGKVEYDVSVAFPEFSIITTENGSYVTGITDFPSSRLIAYLDDSLRDKPVPSNDWWQGLLIADKGYNMYMNPLTATFKNDGLWLTNPGEGYFDGFVPGNGSQTVNVDVHDIAIGYAGMGKDAEVRVTGYSDYGISAVMTDDYNVDKLTVFLSEGTLYAYCIFAEPEKALIRSNGFLGIYDLEGNAILAQTGAEFTGDGIVVKVLTHSGYENGIRKYKDETGEHENTPLYEERYYVVSVPENTRFVLGEDLVYVYMTEGNYMSVGAVGQKNTVKSGETSNAAFPLKEVEVLHEHGYAFVIDTSCLYAFDGVTNTVTTEFRLKTMLVRSGFTDEAYSAYMPHQLRASSYTDGYVYKSIRGDCRSHIGNSFMTQDTFYGLVPTFAEPTDDGYKTSVLYDQLLLVYNNNGGDKKPEDSNLISGDPYWQGKNLHPMAMAAIAADQIGATDLRDAFLDKIQYILEDWFTYDPVQDAKTGAYFYYDSEWGTLYYKNSEFGAGVNLADHYFTFGYYTLAAGVLTSFRPEFANDWGDMVELLIRDYMNPSRNDELFPYMRNYDPFSGHGWAGGYADNNGGNNQESAGEALNSWVGAYLYATAVGDETVRQAAIYGYTTELSAIKHYWFNYYNDFPASYPYGVTGQVYGGSNFFGTFFNGQPLYMYGIHLIPGEEFLTGYGLDENERTQLEKMIDKMREEQRGWDVEEKDKEINAWQHIFIPIVAIYDAQEAIDWYEDVLKTNGNVGNTSEQFNDYYLIHGMNTVGVRTTEIWAENGASATVYVKNGVYTALCWNPTATDKTVVFRDKYGVVGSAIIPAHSLKSCDPKKVTTQFQNYTDVSKFKLNDVYESTDANVTANEVKLGNNGKVSYLVTFGSTDSYYCIKIASAQSGVKLLIDGKELPLTKTANGYESQPVSLSFKHTITVTGKNASVKGITFEPLELQKSDVASYVTASSEKDGASAATNVFDGDFTTRWESIHHHDDEWLKIELDEPTLIYQMRIYWEASSAKEYKVYFSQTGKDGDRTEVYHGTSSQGKRTDYINPSQIMKAKYIFIECIARTLDFGYSIYEIEFYNFNGPIIYDNAANFDIRNAFELENAQVSNGKLVLNNNGSALYHVDFGSELNYYSIKIAGNGTGVKVNVGGVEIPLTKTANGYESQPVALSSKHAVEVSGNNFTVTDCKFEKRELTKVNLSMTATASSREDAASDASNAVDGNMGTRWSSEFNDDEWLQIELAELTTIYQLRIYWQDASAKEYKVYFSQTGNDGDWAEVYHGNFSAGKRTDFVTPTGTMQAKYIRIEGISRTTPYGYSIFEVELYNFNNN